MARGCGSSSIGRYWPFSQRPPFHNATTVNDAFKICTYKILLDQQFSFRLAGAKLPRFDLIRSHCVMMALSVQGLENNVTITSPAVIGGLKSDEYLALNPQVSNML